MSHAHWQDVWQLLPVVVTAVPVVLLLANQLNLLNVSDSTAHTLGSEPAETTFDHQYVSAASGWRVRQCGRSGGVYRPAGATSGALLGRLRSAQRTAGEHAAGATLMLMADVLARALAFPGDLPAGAVLALIGSPCFVWLVRRRG